MTAYLITIGIIFALAFGLVVFVGAPYLPTLTPQIEAAFDLLDLKKGQKLLELGCGDGKVLILAAQKGYEAVGIEINPFLAAIARLRTRRFGNKVRVIWGNYWLLDWPRCDGVYAFLIDSFMPKLEERMRSYGGKMASVAFRIPNRSISREKNGVFLYEYK